MSKYTSFRKEAKSSPTCMSFSSSAMTYLLLESTKMLINCINQSPSKGARRSKLLKELRNGKASFQTRAKYKLTFIRSQIRSINIYSKGLKKKEPAFPIVKKSLTTSLKILSLLTAKS